jgi:tRNA(Ile)-lysidine synthase
MAAPDQNIAEKFRRFFKDRNLLSGTFMAAVSGGIDSVVLCELCAQCGLRFSIAHCNFKLRGQESERDQQFVISLGEKYGVEVIIKSFETEAYKDQQKISIQEAARELRYDWFIELREARQFAATLLAHHADDNIETLLMNFFRGTGLRGLIGMPEDDVDHKFFLRPLLKVRREEIVRFAKDNGLQWVEDSSNASSKYTRNFFRNELLPAIRKVYPQVDDNLLATMERLKGTNDLYSMELEEIKRKVCETRGSEIRIPVLKLLKYEHTSLIYEIIKDYGFGEKQVEEVARLCGATSGRFIESDTHQIIKHRNWLIITPKTERNDTIAFEPTAEAVSFIGGRLRLKTMSKEAFRLVKKQEIAQLDTRNIEYPLLLRKWRQGDYFYPLGMCKKKKVARFFIDQRLSKNEKQNIWVLESNRKILWVVGMRIDERFKVTESTKEVLVITYQGETRT